MILLSTDSEPHKTECKCEDGHITKQVVDLFVGEKGWKLIPRDGFCHCGKFAYVTNQDF